MNKLFLRGFLYTLILFHRSRCRVNVNTKIPTKASTLGVWLGGTLPWVGVLLYKEDIYTKEAITGIVLINKKQAIGNAYIVSKIERKNIRNTTNAMFMTSQFPTFFEVTDYIVHPEFDDSSLNTIALIHLEDDEERYQSELLSWPGQTLALSTLRDDVFAVGFTDRRGVLEQIAYRMEHINTSDCLRFYEKEGLDTKWMTPVDYQCFVVKYSSGQCVFDAGMALVTNHTGKWTLLGVSTLGPGCSLPSRFMNFPHYMPWIEKKTNATRRSSHILTKDEYKKYWTEEELSLRNLDKYLMSSIDNETIILTPVTATTNATTETLTHGNCSMLGELIFKDEVKLIVSGPKEDGVGIYAFSGYDFSIANITCINVTINAAKRSDLQVWTTKGFQQDDIDSFMRIIPIRHRGFTLRPKIVYKMDDWKIYDAIDIQHMFFKFEYYKQARIYVSIYGLLWADASSSTTSTPLTRTRRSHRTHIRNVFNNRRFNLNKSKPRLRTSL